MCDSPELLSALAKLTAIVERQTLKRDYNDQTYAVSDTQGFVMDYKGYRYLFVYSGTALTFLLGSTSYPIAANTWTSLAYKEGYKIFTTGQATPVNVRVRATDDVLALLTVGGGGGGGVVTQGTNPWVVSGSVTQGTSPWVVQVSNVNANGQESMLLSSPVVIASDQSAVPVSAATGGIVDLLTLLNALAIAQGAALGTTPGPMVQGSVSTNGPTYTPGQIEPLSLSTNGSLRVQNNISGSGVVGGNGVTNAQTQRITIASDSTGQVNIANANANGQNTSVNSAPVVIASDQPPVAVMNSERYYTLLGKVFWVASLNIATATNGNLTVCALSLFNASTSGKTLEIFSIIPFAQENLTTDSIYLRQTTTDPGNTTGFTASLTPQNELFGGASSAASTWSSPNGITTSITQTGTQLEGIAMPVDSGVEILQNGRRIILPNGSNFGIELNMFVTTAGHAVGAIVGYIER